MHGTWLYVSGSGVKHQGKFWEAQRASGSIRGPQGRVSEAVGWLRDVTLQEEKDKGNVDHIKYSATPRGGLA